MQELNFEKRCLELKGKKISKVYYEIPTSSSSLVHSVSKAIYLVMTDSSIFKFTYADEFSLRWGYGISVSQIIKIEKDVELEEVNWGNELIVQDVKIYWRYIWDSHFVLWHHYHRADYPQDILLQLENDQEIYIGVGKLLKDEKIKLFTNHLIVFLSKEERDKWYKNIQK